MELMNLMDKKQKINELNPGDILVSSWGYEQTNIDFFQVIKSTEKMATVQQIRGRIISQNGNMTGTVEPVKNAFEGTPFRRKIKRFSDELFISITSFSSASFWGGKPEHYSSYA